MKRVILIVALVLNLFAISRAEQLPIRTYTTADSLARDRVYKIVSDPRGFVWFCTYDGLSRFDGYEFVNYTIAHGLPHRVVFDLLITKTGDYWIATSNGIARFNAFATTPENKFRATTQGLSEFSPDPLPIRTSFEWTQQGLLGHQKRGQIVAGCNNKLATRFSETM